MIYDNLVLKALSQKKFVFTTDKKVKMHSKESEINDKLSSIIGDKFVEYRKKFDAVNKFEMETDFPLYMQIELHQICNLQCPMCSIGAPEANQKYVTDQKMSWETFEKIILECEKYQCPSLNPQGINEPLLTSNLEDHIRFAKKHGFVDIMMNTNATLLSEERAKKLLESGLTRIRFSLDAATKETYDKIRIGGDYEKVIKNIERFLDIKEKGGYELPIVGVNLCKMKTNEHEVEQFMEMWENKVDFVAIQNFTPPELQSDYSNFIPTESEYNDSMVKNFRCEQPWQRIYIKNNGAICPCCTFFNEELVLGNISNKTIHELWNSQEMKSLRQLHKEGRYYDNPWCNSCVKCTTGKTDDELIKLRTSSN